MATVTSRAIMLDTRTQTATARLVLAVGSRAGLEAPLQRGYYMIGRHAECQIRPKSRSVSRRHCLLFQDDHGLQVLDLNSTAGTRVNDLRVRPMTWTVLRDGDMLRCGKVVFRVAMQPTAEPNHPGSSASITGNGKPPSKGVARSMAVGEAWHDVDIAGFLETQDDADREARYHSIRSAGKSPSADDSAEDLPTASEIDTDLDLFDDAFDDPLSPEGTPPETTSSAGTIQDGPVAAAASSVVAHASSTETSESSRTPAAEPKRSRKQRRADRLSKRAAAKSTRQSSSGGIAFQADRWKLIGLALVTLVTLSLLGYSAYSFYNGPNVRVLDNID